MMLAIQTEEDEEEAQAQVLEKEKRNSFALSQSGTFKLSDFAVNKGGMHDTPDPKTPAGAAAPSQPAAGRLDVKSLDELVMMEELGAGASGSVRKAKHMPTGEIVAVKQITILEKAKRDQVVSELRIMKKHGLGAKWLVAMHNAFYEDARVYTVLEMMDGGSVEVRLARAAARRVRVRVATRLSPWRGGPQALAPDLSPRLACLLLSRLAGSHQEARDGRRAQGRGRASEDWQAAARRAQLPASPATPGPS